MRWRGRIVKPKDDEARVSDGREMLPEWEAALDELVGDLVSRFIRSTLMDDPEVYIVL